MRSRLYSSFHPVILRLASARFSNQLAFKHSSRSRPLKLSTWAVLGRLYWLDVDELNPPFFAPAQKMAAGQFRPVVAPNGLRRPTPFNHFVKRARDALARETSVDFQGQAFPCEGIHHGEHSNASSAGERIASEIQRPFLIGMPQLRRDRSVAFS